jgi:hypothetical protein
MQCAGETLTIESETREKTRSANNKMMDMQLAIAYLLSLL